MENPPNRNGAMTGAAVRLSAAGAPAWRILNSLRGMIPRGIISKGMIPKGMHTAIARAGGILRAIGRMRLNGAPIAAAGREGGARPGAGAGGAGEKERRDAQADAGAPRLSASFAMLERLSLGARVNARVSSRPGGDGSPSRPLRSAGAGRDADKFRARIRARRDDAGARTQASSALEALRAAASIPARMIGGARVVAAPGTVASALARVQAANASVASVGRLRPRSDEPADSSYREGAEKAAFAQAGSDGAATRVFDSSAPLAMLSRLAAESLGPGAATRRGVAIPSGFFNAGNFLPRTLSLGQPPVTAAPALAAVPLRRRGAEPSGASSLVINSAPAIQIHSSEPVEIERRVLDALREHREALFEQWHQELERRQRTEF